MANLVDRMRLGNTQLAVLVERVGLEKVANLVTAVQKVLVADVLLTARRQIRSGLGQSVSGANN